MGQPPCRAVCWSLTKRTVLLPYDPAVTRPDVSPEEVRTHVHTNPAHDVRDSFMRHCQPLGPFVQSCSAAGGWIREPSIQPVGEYSALRGNEPSRHEKTRRDRERGSLSDRSRSEKAASRAIPATGLSGEGTTVVAVTGPWLQGRGEEG